MCGGGCCWLEVFAYDLFFHQGVGEADTERNLDQRTCGALLHRVVGEGS